MISIFDVFKDKDFRTPLQNALNEYDPSIILPPTIPPLFKYVSFSKYIVKNIVSASISLSLIASFNDCYDSTISFGKIEDRAYKEFEDFNRVSAAAGMESCLSLDAWIEQIEKEQYAYRGFCHNWYCCCLSKNHNSTLMWSHYADNNRGICIEYDFEDLKNHPLYYAIFPVCYSSIPIDVYDYMHEKKGHYSIELGALISTLNKAKCWEYEQEWRLVYPNESLNSRPLNKYIAMPNMPNVKSVTIGQNFLDNFFPELTDGTDSVNENFARLKALIAVLKALNIPLNQTIASQHNYLQQLTSNLDSDLLLRFIDDAIKNRDFTLKNRDFIYLCYQKEVLKVK